MVKRYNTPTLEIFLNRQADVLTASIEAYDVNKGDIEYWG